MGGGEVLEHLGGLGLLSAEMLEDEGVELRVQWGPWPDPTPRIWLQGEAARTGQGCPPADRGALGGCSAEGRT